MDKNHRKFLLNCLIKNDIKFNEYYNKLEDKNKIYERKMNDRIGRLKREIKKTYNEYEKDDKMAKMMLGYRVKLERLILDKVKYGVNSMEKFVKSRYYKTALLKSNQVCKDKMVRYKKVCENNLDEIFKKLEYMKELRGKGLKDEKVEFFYTQFVKIIDILQYEIKLINSILQK